MQVIQPGPSSIPPKDDHLTPHEDCSGPQARGRGGPVCGGAVPSPCGHVQEVHIIQAFLVCCPTPKNNQPAHCSSCSVLTWLLQLERCCCLGALLLLTPPTMSAALVWLQHSWTKACLDKPCICSICNVVASVEGKFWVECCQLATQAVTLQDLQVHDCATLPAYNSTGQESADGSLSYPVLHKTSAAHADMHTQNRPLWRDKIRLLRT